MTGTPASRGSLTHEPDRFSDPAWELLLAGQDMARRWRHDQLDVEHLIQVLFSDSSFRRWVEPLPLRSDDLLDRLEDVLADQPPARGDQLFIGEDLEQLLETADQVRGRWGDRSIDVPQLIVAVGADPRIGAELFAAQGLAVDRLESLLRQPSVTPAPAPFPAPTPAPTPRSAPAPRVIAPEPEPKVELEREPSAQIPASVQSCLQPRVCLLIGWRVCCVSRRFLRPQHHHQSQLQPRPQPQRLDQLLPPA